MITRTKMLMICPAPRGSLKGNRITAVRWHRLLKQLGHRVTIAGQYDGQPCDLLIALHARRSAESIRRFAELRPHVPLVVALTGTDLYRDIRVSRRARRSLDLAWRLVLLQPRGLDELAREHRRKARVIFQSAKPTPGRRRPPWPRPGGDFRVCVMGHLRWEKDPRRAAMATRLLPASSRVHVTHVGGALQPSLADWATAETQRNSRYTWLGEVPFARARRILADSDLMILSSRMEGGANVLSEAIADAVPILASHIPSTVGILGPRFPGYFPVGNTAKLAELLARAETDVPFYRCLEDWSGRLASLVRPSAEAAAWERLIRELQ